MVRFREFVAPTPEAMQAFKKRMRNATLSFISDHMDDKITVLVSPFSDKCITESALECGLEEVSLERA